MLTIRREKRRGSQGCVGGMEPSGPGERFGQFPVSLRVEWRRRNRLA